MISLLSPYPVAVSLIRIKQIATGQGLLQSDLLSQMESIFTPVIGSSRVALLAEKGMPTACKMTSLKWLSQDPSGYLCRVLSALWLGNATDLLAHVLIWDENKDSLDINT